VIVGNKKGVFVFENQGSGTTNVPSHQ